MKNIVRLSSALLSFSLLTACASQTLPLALNPALLNNRVGAMSTRAAAPVAST